MSNANSPDPMEFLRNLWGGNGFSLPGMVTPTLDTDEIEKQIRDLKTVEGWLRTNLSMLSMTIQNLEMQRTTLTAMKNMSQMYSETAPAKESGGAFSQAAAWPWNMMQQMQESMQAVAAETAAEAARFAQQGAATRQSDETSAEKKPARGRTRKSE